MRLFDSLNSEKGSLALSSAKGQQYKHCSKKNVKNRQERSALLACRFRLSVAIG